MDVPPDFNLYLPTLPSRTVLSSPAIEYLFEVLALQTRSLHLHPYDPTRLLKRAETLQQLQYPELAAAEAWKAQILLEHRLSTLKGENGWCIGLHNGFLMRDEDAVLEKDEFWYLSLLSAEKKIEGLLEQSFLYLPSEFHGRTVRYLPQLYPWISARHTGRSDEMVAELNATFAANITPTTSNLGPYCELRRDAFGAGKKEVLGVFAKRDVKALEVVLLDESSLWGKNWAGGKPKRGYYDGNGNGDDWERQKPGDGWPEGSVIKEKLLGGANGDNHAGHEESSKEPNGNTLPSWRRGRKKNPWIIAEETNYGWLQDATDTEAADVILRCKMLEAAFRADCPHPLDYSLVARLTPTYQPRPVESTKPLPDLRTLNLQTDIALPLLFLSRNLHLDIFAPSLAAYTSPHIILTLAARLDNNAWSDILTTTLSPLFCLFNHSCEPNLDWDRPVREPQNGILTVRMKAVRDVEKGEQFFVAYDWFCLSQPVGERKKSLGKWLVGGCGCGRCVREEAEEREREEKGETGTKGGWKWDRGVQIEMTDGKRVAW